MATPKKTNAIIYFDAKEKRTVSDPEKSGPIGNAVNRLIRGEGIMGNKNTLPPGDYAHVPTLGEALILSRRAQERFEALPSRIRDRFGNSAVALNNFMGSEEKGDIDESIRLGLRTQPKSTTPPPKPAVIPPTPEAIAANMKMVAEHFGINPKETPSD